MKKLIFVALMACSISVFAQTDGKNGTIYKTHPILDLAAQVGALYQKGDADGMAKFYADTCKFFGPGSDKPSTLAQAVAQWKKDFADWNPKLTIQGYPDGLDYTKEGFVVQIWFAFSGVNTKTKKPASTNMVLFLSFNKDKKISSSLIYFDPTPLLAAAQ
jgi:ketosteroid isomerase-like protein